MAERTPVIWIVIVEETHVGPKKQARIERVTRHDDLVCRLSGAKNAIWCKTRKEAEEIRDTWNHTFWDNYHQQNEGRGNDN